MKAMSFVCLLVSLVMVGCGRQEGVVSTEEELMKYATPPELQKEWDKQAAESAQRDKAEQMQAPAAGSQPPI